MNQEEWTKYMRKILASKKSGKLKQKDHKLKDSQGYIENLRLARAGQGT